MIRFIRACLFLIFINGKLRIRQGRVALSGYRIVLGHTNPCFPRFIVEIMLLTFFILYSHLPAIFRIIAVSIGRCRLFCRKFLFPAIFPVIQLILHLFIRFFSGRFFCFLLTVIVAFAVCICPLLCVQRTPVFYICIGGTFRTCFMSLFFRMCDHSICAGSIGFPVDPDLSACQHLICQTIMLGHSHLRLHCHTVRYTG